MKRAFKCLVAVLLLGKVVTWFGPVVGFAYILGLVGVGLWLLFRKKKQPPAPPTQPEPMPELPVQHVVVTHIHTIDRSAEWPEEITVDESGVTRAPLSAWGRRAEERRRREPWPQMFTDN